MLMRTIIHIAEERGQKFPSKKVSLVGAGRTSVSLKNVSLKTSSQTLPSNFFTLEPEISIEKGRKPSRKSISGQTARSCLTERQLRASIYQLIPLLLPENVKKFVVILRS